MKYKILILATVLSLVGCNKTEKNNINQQGLSILDGTNQSNNNNKKNDGLITKNGIIQSNSINWGIPNQNDSDSLSVQQLNQQHYFRALVAEVEGYRAYLYNDNKGYAIGMGWNVSMQTRQTNEKIASTIGLPSNQASQLVALSSMHKERPLPRYIQLTPSQAFQAVEWMKPQFEEPIKQLIGQGFDQLAPNKQAVLIYHVYKVGPEGAAKYHHLIADVKQFIKNPTEQLNEKIAKDFTYKYTINGTVKQDTRSQMYMASMWLDPSSFSYIVSKEPVQKLPQDMPVIASTFQQKVNINEPIEPQIKNPVQDRLNTIYQEGKTPTVELVNPNPIIRHDLGCALTDNCSIQ